MSRDQYNGKGVEIMRGEWRSDIFPRRTGLTIWLCESKSSRNLSNRSHSSQKVEVKTLLCFFSFLTVTTLLNAVTYGPKYTVLLHKFDNETLVSIRIRNIGGQCIS